MDVAHWSGVSRTFVLDSSNESRVGRLGDRAPRRSLGIFYSSVGSCLSRRRDDGRVWQVSEMDVPGDAGLFPVASLEGDRYFVSYRSAPARCHTFKKAR